MYSEQSSVIIKVIYKYTIQGEVRITVVQPIKLT